MLLTVAGPVDPVEAEVYPEPCQHPGGGGVPGQRVEAVVLVDVEIRTTNMRRHKRSECFSTTITYVLKSVTRRYSLHKTSEETVDNIHDSIIYPRCVPLETLEAPLEEDEAEEVRRGAGHQREGDGGHVGEGGLARGHQVEHPPQTLTYQLLHKDRASVNKSIYRERVICRIHVQLSMYK